MSGIAGLVRHDGAPADEEVLRRMAASLVRRAPHGTHLWSGGPAGLAHALLATGDEARSLPQPTTLGELWVAADARIDARDDLVRRLRAAGELASPDAPAAELILRAYRAWGEECPARLLGDFAFAVWDAPRRRLFCARDPFGVKPFYYAALPHAFVFSNTLDAVRLHPGVADTLDEAAVGDFLLFGVNLDPASTAFAAVRALPPAHRLAVEDGGVRPGRYWSLPVEDAPRRGRVRDHVERFTALLDRAVADRLPRGPAALLLSGGADSTAVAATAVEHAPRGALHAVTAGYDRLLPDPEPRFARRAAEHLGIGWECHALDGYRVYQGWADGTLRTPEPVHAPLFAGTLGLYRRAAAHAPVALTGDGGDLALRESESRLARLLLGGRPLRALAEAAEYAWWHRRLPRPGFRTLRARRRGELGAAPPLPAWLEPEFARRLGLAERLAEVGGTPPAAHPLRPEAHRRLASPSLPRLLERFDPGVTGLPLHFRHPLLDVRLVEDLLYMAPAQWYNDKGLLKIAMRGRLPPEIVRRPKTPLAGDPVLAWRARGGAGWLVGVALSPRVEPFVVPARVPRAAGGRGPDGDPARLDEDLRPLSLSLWLEAAP